MPLGELKKSNSRIQPTNLALYSDYILGSTMHGLGYGTKEKAEKTLKKIKNKPINYQVSLVNTMIGRAQNHKYRNKDMNQAIKVFKNWLKKYKKTQKNKPKKNIKKTKKI